MSWVSFVRCRGVAGWGVRCPCLSWVSFVRCRCVAGLLCYGDGTRRCTAGGGAGTTPSANPGDGSRRSSVTRALARADKRRSPAGDAMGIGGFGRRSPARSRAASPAASAAAAAQRKSLLSTTTSPKRRERRKSSVVVGATGRVMLRPVMPPRPVPPPTQQLGLHPWLQGVHQEVMLLPEWQKVGCTCCVGVWLWLCGFVGVWLWLWL